MFVWTRASARDTVTRSFSPVHRIQLLRWQACLLDWALAAVLVLTFGLVLWAGQWLSALMMAFTTALGFALGRDWI